MFCKCYIRPVNQYGIPWPDDASPLEIELGMIRRRYGQPGAVAHYLAAHRLLWPEDQPHRWFVQGLTAIVENKVTVLLGCASSGKTYLMAVHALIDFFAFPHTTLSLLSSTDIRSLELRIWGRGIKFLFNRAKTRFPELPGYVLESKLAIVPDEVDEDSQFAREINKGLVCVPCVSGGRFVGMSKFQGVKPPSSPGKNDGILKHYGDEVAVMQPSLLDGYTNWMANARFKGVMAGNPTDISDPLCTASEPVGGWDAFIDNEKTQVWRSRWHDSFCLAFDGRDTPNGDEPKDQYAFLASADFVPKLVATYGADSWQVYQQGIGKPSKGMVSNRVITLGLCERHHAFDLAIWQGAGQTKLYALDPAYGGGDRCVGGELQFGPDKNGQWILSVASPEIIPIRLHCGIEPEEQIADFIWQRSQSLRIPPENIFYDAFGRGTLGFAFAKKFGAACPVPVDSGGRPTDRPVRFDLFVDEPNGVRRLKRCDEHYSKFVTEMWFSTREAIESGQVRDLPLETAREGQLRLFKVVAGNKVEVETKDDMKERIKKSPDLYDQFAIGVEGARRLGFRIERIGRDVKPPSGKEEDFFETETKEWDALLKSGMLKRSTPNAFA
jgi:hypothetical protein